MTETMTDIHYVIISPVRNEAEHIKKTIESVISQTVRPAQWIIVNDGSTDETGTIIEEAATLHSWIKNVYRPDRGVRRAGEGVMEAFYAGFNLIGSEQWQYVVKLDGDLTFEPDYFQRCFARFTQEPRLGIAGGLVCKIVNGTRCEESKVDPAFHVRGPTKIYRRECWQAIGGLVSVTGWDTIDELKANMLGWSTRTLSDVQIIHNRPSGAAYGAWPNWVKNGRANYVAGYHPAFMLLKCISRTFTKPYGIAAAGLWFGYCSGYLSRAWRIADPEFVRYFRGQQLRRLLGRPSVWG
jgi:glycosyltransferase involved in cell wall biosynthesis